MANSDFLQLDAEQAPPRNRTGWLAEQVRDAIMAGTLSPDTRLPASRVLAEELSMARGTVVEAYRRLSEEGLLVTNRGGGTSVAELAPVPVPTQPSGPASTTPPHALDISSGMPDLNAFPRTAWMRAERRVLATATGPELGYTDPQGAPALRDALAGWLARSRGVAVEPSQIIVTAGVTGGLSLLAQVLRERGITACAVEDPSAEGTRHVLDYWLDTIVPVRVDEQGLDVAELARTGARAVLVTPAHQFPTGVVLSPARRRELVTWADEVNGLVIEDDYDAEYRYDRAPVRAMQAMAPHRVIHISSLSKVLAPALRIGWMTSPTALHADLVRRRWATDLGSPTLAQLALAELIKTGTLERHLRSLRTHHRRRRDAALEALGNYMPGCIVEGIAAGLHLVLRLPDHIDDTELATRAKEAGIAVDTLSQHRSAPGPPGLIIGYGPHPTPQLEQAIQTLGALASLHSS